MKNVVIIGAGQIGSRHLQAFKRVKFPLNITVVDPSQESLAVAQQRYEEMPKGKYQHEIKYLSKVATGQNIDLAIVATTSDIRAKVTRDVLKNNRVRYFILEKILFDKNNDYLNLENIFSKLGIRAWVNLPRRVVPIYKKVKKELVDGVVSVRCMGGQWPLASNSVHFIDLTSYFTEISDCEINTQYLDKKILSSRRKGFLEVTGMLYANFKNGSRCELVSHSSGNAPFVIEIFNKDVRYIIWELEGKYWTSGIKNNWQWEEFSFKPLLVSETTTEMVENILINGNCFLTPYKESLKIHLALLEPLRRFINKNLEKKYEYYPFT